jgi:hypothetical protein
VLRGRDVEDIVLAYFKVLSHDKGKVPSNPNIAPSGNYPTPSRHVHIRNNENKKRGRGLRVRLRVAQLVKKISAFMGCQVQQNLHFLFHAIYICIHFNIKLPSTPTSPK